MAEVDPMERMRRKMVERDIAARGVKDQRVLDAMLRVRREEFVDPLSRGEACADHPLPISCGQTISQPYIVAYMTEALRLTGKEKVLEIGTGSGYQAAVLAELAREVYTVERHEELSERARSILERLGCNNIHFRVGDGSLGWQKEAPFDAVIVTAAVPDIPGPLMAQLAPGGRLIAPVGTLDRQDLVLLTKNADGSCDEKPVMPCIFVPLIGIAGFLK